MVLFMKTRLTSGAELESVPSLAEPCLLASTVCSNTRSRDNTYTPPVVIS